MAYIGPADTKKDLFLPADRLATRRPAFDMTTPGQVDGFSVSQFGVALPVPTSIWLRFPRINDDPAHFAGPAAARQDGVAELKLDGVRVAVVLDGDIRLLSRGLEEQALPLDQAHVPTIFLPAAGPDHVADIMAAIAADDWPHGQGGVRAANAHAALGFKTNLFRKGEIVRALELGLRGQLRESADPGVPPLDHYRATLVLADILKAIDGMGSSARIWVPGTLGAAITSLVLYPECVAMWQRVVDRKGNMLDGATDPVQAVLVACAAPGEGDARENHINLYQRCMNAALHWHRQTLKSEPVWIKQRINAIETGPMISELREVLGITGDTRL